jgi:CspA family cold shock protein
MREFTSAGLENGHSAHDEIEPLDGKFYEGVIDNLKPDRGFGFIRREDGQSFFFHVTHLTNAEWSTLQTGQKARFTVTKLPAGAQAGSAGDVAIIGDDEP